MKEKIECKRMYVPSDVLEELDKIKAFYNLDSYSDAMRRMANNSKAIMMSIQLLRDVDIGLVYNKSK